MAGDAEDGAETCPGTMSGGWSSELIFHFLEAIDTSIYSVPTLSSLPEHRYISD
jgi:hypothetical protein